jgi:hypothetical protein
MRPSHSLPYRWLEYCDEILGKSTTSGGDPTDVGIGMTLGDVAFLH